MNKLQKEIKRKQWQEKKTDNYKKKKALLKEIIVIKHQLEAVHENY